MDIDSLLTPFKHFGVNLGLERILQLLKNLGNPHKSVPVIHVAGTNGKGSVCAYLSSILTAAGYRTGRYTSPHLIDWTERICFNEQPISSEELQQVLLEVKTAITTREANNSDTSSPTQFEVLTAAAWLYFAKKQVDVAVVEVGLGGRLDATNVCEEPLVTIITSISFDHVQVLGPTISDIAREKAGILKYKCPVVMGPLPADAETVVRTRAKELECPIISPHIARQFSPTLAEYRYSQSKEKDIKNYQSLQYPLSLHGAIQLANSSLVLAAVEILQNQGWLISESAIIAGMEKTKWLGRMQWTTWKDREFTDRRLLVDGAHNPASAKALRDYVDTLGVKSIFWVMGMLSTKDHTQVFQALLRPEDKLYLLPVADHSSAQPENLAKLAAEVCPRLKFCNVHTDLFSALDTAFSKSDQSQDLVVLCGSLYLVGYFFANRSN
ncbi:bifunctional folylpolyglutamate synthase/dihydrofolate synthase [Mastigocoleus testarum]|uniref:Dihydrofolate synthase/folylpolyglutamate synthase n=1 Tax=Mastigocoleus testarum BC008 TaxID=371196 RepID=A0A0V7ZX62_9CYAN|nr:folylpolyglutamate synthase/dihydrofolate synthase family protein [Mastigocoleus testarum]KST68184.1 bifunctional folylpolyglutamate synthase/dihydrofolate synthase [Mastigocoleus testarum BC008]KST68847.1 bifunctional folylpolyglutamate synthase/dihydrofolate synthase [Mastigocoleus testarum BC008]